MTTAATSPVLPPLARPVSTLPGVGPERAAQLARLEISTVEDLLLHRPRRYEDRRQCRRISELQLGEPVTTRGSVVALGVKWFRQHTKSVFELILTDGSARLHCRWWNLPFMEKYFAVGDEVVVFGKLLGLKPRTIDHPETETVETGEEAGIHFNRITPVYGLTEGLSQRWLRGLIWRTLSAVEAGLPDPYPALTQDLFLSRPQAVRRLHFPDEPAEVEAARRRLALDEFIELQRQIQLRRKKFESKSQSLPCLGDNHLIKPFLACLSYKLTDAQTRVLRELRQDMSGAHPMRRLLQGDVGSGKTVVAACCALMALESGYGVALMAPTEILAEQHFQNFTRWFEPLGVGVALQTGSRKLSPEAESERGAPASRGDGFARSRSSALRTSADPEAAKPASAPRLTIGTHALIESGFAPENLGLVIIDEQHKFGVAQREQLVRKGRYPHLLVMTATPIPRTLGLTLYGELDISTIDQMPPGRGRVRTFVRGRDKLPKVWAFIRDNLARGRQAYVVYPRVEEGGGQNDLKAVTKELETLRRELAPYQVGLVHGRLKSQEKEAAMAGFRDNRTQVLLATSLIEVGVDVPNATLMLIENAEQFGLAQLHQLRGRIGRGAHDSYCILVAAARNPEARRRLRVLEETVDGFRIAEADLQLRGPGDLVGQRQSGLARFRFGDLATDLALIQQARGIAAQLVK